VFNSEADRYNNSSIIEIGEVTLTGRFLPAGKLSAIIKSIKNIGGKRFSSTVKMSGNAVSSIGAGRVELEGSSSNRGQSINAKDIGQIKTNVALNANNTVNVNIGGTVKQLSFKITYETVLKSFIHHSTDQEMKETLNKYIYGVLKTEWDSSKKNTYIKNVESSLLKRTVDFAIKNGAESEFASIANKLRKMLPAEKKKFWGPDKKRAAFLALLDKLQ
jgi:hypothetical protein